MTRDAKVDQSMRMDDGEDGARGVNRREFLQWLGAGLLITATGGSANAQRGSFGGSDAQNVSARIHIAEDGTITVLTGKVEMGQGARAELTQAAAEELRVPVSQINLVMGDTDLVPDDGTTAGSKTTPRTVPAVRKGAAAARSLLVGLACERWKAAPDAVEARDGVIQHESSGKKLSYADLAKAGDAAKAFEAEIPSGVEVTPVKEWKILGTSVPRANLRDLVTGAHKFPSDISRPDMLYGKVLRAPSYGAALVSTDLSAAQAMKGVVVVRDGDFIGCAAPTSFLAAQAIEAIAQATKWKIAPHPSSNTLFEYLKKNARAGGGGGRGGRGPRDAARNSEKVQPAPSAKTLRENYEVAYIQHAPMEPRAAVAEWTGDKLTVWTGSQAPARVQSDLAQAFSIPLEKVRVIIPDTGGGFGGKHSGETAVEAARLAKAAERPVSLRWTRTEEFTWAYFRPAALIEIEAGLDAKGQVTSWDFTNINSGESAIQTPYAIPGAKSRYLHCADAPLRPGSYRCLAATANNFARESFMDELAAAAGEDPLAFRLRHLQNERLRAVLETAAERFKWKTRRSNSTTGFGLACGTEKGSFVAACVEVGIDRAKGEIAVRRVCEVFEAGAVLNPDNLRAQVMGCIIMGLGAALREEMRFENGQILNASFGAYRVPRFRDIPELDIHLLNRPDLPSEGGGETPIIAIAPAIANAVFAATGKRIRSMPIRGEALKRA